MNIKIGNGYDVHKLIINRDLIIGGVKINYKLGLLGHSDGDVLIHSIIDALCGAMGIGDIGNQFPDNDEQYKNISSTILLEKIHKILKKNNFKIINIDSIVIIQSPKIVCFIKQMKTIIADILNIKINQINIKATTEEHLGFTGANLGVAAHAVCLLYN